MEGVTGLYQVGGEASSFSIDEGIYHIKVTDAQNGETKDKTRGVLLLTFTVNNDPDHPAKEGKKLLVYRQNYAKPGDDIETQKQIMGFWKRLIFGGFGLKWNADGPKDFDPKKLLEREAWVVAKKKGEYVNIVAIAQDKDSLPAFVPSAAAIAATTGTKNGETKRTRR